LQASRSWLTRWHATFRYPIKSKPFTPDFSKSFYGLIKHNIKSIDFQGLVASVIFYPVIRR